MARPRKTTVNPPPNATRDPSAPECDYPGCGLAGEYRAPYSPQELDKYRWFCLDHVREYNKSWDFFTGMHSSQIEDFMKDAMLGHRPTWKINQTLTEEKLEEALHAMLHGNRRGYREQRRKQAAARRMPEEERRALAVLNLEGEVSLQEIKKQYKLLVKKHHPDVNKGKDAEERFKRITEAYQDILRIRAARTEG